VNNMGDEIIHIEILHPPQISESTYQQIS